jgi:predicted ATPase/DNA-binding SARP family transcriptional activator
MSIESGATVVDEGRLGGTRARLAFALLVLERPRPVDRNRLAEVLWPDALPASWEAALRVVVSRVRAVLGAAGLPAAEILTHSHGCYQLVLPDDVVVDVEEAAATVDAAEASWAAGAYPRALTQAGAARAIAARLFIAGVEGEWLAAMRRRQLGLRLRALDVTVRSAIQLGEPTIAVAAAQELLDLDPYRDASHVLVMEAHRAAGNRAEALRTYGWCRRVLSEELGVDPSPETEALYRSLLREEHGRRPAPDVVWAPSAADVAPNSLPVQLSTLVGRDRELAEVRKLVQAERLVTLTGPPGTGKTRLAVEIARGLLATHADGTWFVDLATVVDGAGVAPAMAAAVGMADESSRDVVDALVEHLRPREVILVVDTCEPVLGAAAVAVDILLRACPLLWVLATSRERLGVPGEVVWRVPPLSTPDLEPGSRGSWSMEAVLEYEAARLFVERSRALVADLAFTDRDADALAEICVRLDGLPLAIELAAACVTTLSVQQIAARLDDPFRLLTLGHRTAPPRHRTLLKALEWSHALLTPHHQVLLRRLAALPGGFTLDEAEEIGAAIPGIERSAVLDLLVGLVNASLVVSDTAGAEARYGFLETIRQFARMDP